MAETQTTQQTTQTTQTTQTAPWFQGKADAETVGYLQNRGWDSKSAEEVAFEAIKAHREAERHIGIPANELLRIPKAGDEVATKAFWGRLGAPDDAKGYDFSGVKFSDESPLEDAFVQEWANELAGAHVPKDVALRLTQKMVKMMENGETADAAERTAKLAEEKANLARDWGRNKDANMLIAKNAVAKLGISPDAVAALENQIGYKSVMDMFLKIGQSIGEDKFITNSGSATSGVMSREQAMAKLADLKADNAWTKRYLDGGAAEKREMAALHAIIVGDDTEESRRA